MQLGAQLVGNEGLVLRAFLRAQNQDARWQGVSRFRVQQSLAVRDVGVPILRLCG